MLKIKLIKSFIALLSLLVPLQQESEKAFSEKLAVALEECDIKWNEKMAAQQQAHNEMVALKVSSILKL